MPQNKSKPKRTFTQNLKGALEKMGRGGMSKKTLSGLTKPKGPKTRGQ